MKNLKPKCLSNQYKILITGANGYLGKSLSNALDKDFQITNITRKDFDLRNSKSMFDFFKDKKFDVVLNCSSIGGNRTKNDDWNVLTENLTIFYNLLQFSDNYNKLINFGSGAEFTQNASPYGLSKFVISKSIISHPKLFNIRIFAVFDENELDSRLIKSNIIRYLRDEELFLFNNKKMDFFYMKDLISVVKFYIINNILPKEFDCTYEKTKTILEILENINELDNKKSKITVVGELDKDYCGNYTNLGLEYIGLEKGIQNVYDILKERNIYKKEF